LTAFLQYILQGRRAEITRNHGVTDDECTE
jgi:hypothetical protein